MEQNKQGIKVWVVSGDPDFTLIHIHRPDNVRIHNGDENETYLLREIEKIEMDKDKGLVVSGSLPIFIFAKFYKVFKEREKGFRFFAQYDPRLGGVVIDSCNENEILSIISKERIENLIFLSQSKDAVVENKATVKDSSKFQNEDKRDWKINFIVESDIGEHSQMLSVRLHSNIEVADLREKIKGFPLEQLDKKKGVIISGKAPIWLYLSIYRVLSFYSFRFIAIETPQGPILIEDSAEDSGTILVQEWKNYNEKLSNLRLSEGQRTIAVFGPPHSGKSVFLFGLLKKLELIKGSEYFENVYLLRSCPDGEGFYGRDIPADLFSRLRNKGAYSEKYFRDVVEDLEFWKERKKYVFVDCGGKADHYNEEIASLSTDVIIVTNDVEKLSEWYKIIPEVTKVLAEVKSVLGGNVDRNVKYEDGRMKFTMCGLERGNENNLEFPEEFLRIFN